MSATGDERRRARQLGEYLKHMPLHLSRNNPPYPEEVMSDLVELTVELVEPYIPHLVRVLGSYDPTYRDAARDALTRLVERGVLSSSSDDDFMIEARRLATLPVRLCTISHGLTYGEQAVIAALVRAQRPIDAKLVHEVVSCMNERSSTRVLLKDVELALSTLKGNSSANALSRGFLFQHVPPYGYYVRSVDDTKS
ncbi:hypothetical protein RI054_43g150910 [Pseudoscourfieldia marina]